MHSMRWMRWICVKKVLENVKKCLTLSMYTDIIKTKTAFLERGT